MTHIKSKDYVLLAGKEPNIILNENPFEIYNKDVLSFLETLSIKLLSKDQKDRRYINFRGFGFWARRSNLESLKRARKDLEIRFGRGPTLHIAPSNISANALYTFAFGLLSGCPCIIRLSKRNIEELEAIIALINELLQFKEFKNISNKYSFIYYEHQASLNTELSSSVDARIIWGGDQTIQIFKSFTTSSNCIDLVFPDKVSTSILSANWLISADESELKNKADLYSRDIGLFSQMACSSPSSLILLKDCKDDYSEFLLNFFQKCDSLLSRKEWLSEMHALSNFKSSIDICMQFPTLNCIYKGQNLSAFFLEKSDFEEVSVHKPKDTCLFVYVVDSLEEVSSLIDKNNQTMVCIGLKKEIKDKLTKKIMIKGINRVVNVGNALNMNIFWDGYDIVSYLSKLISFN